MRRLLPALFLLYAASARAQAPAGNDYVIRNFEFRAARRCPSSAFITSRSASRGGTRAAWCATRSSSFTEPAVRGRIHLRTFGGELFGPGQLLDTAKYFVVLPDGIGHGKSSKPSDGMHASFPKYTYNDMVDAQHELLDERARRQSPAAGDGHVDGLHARLGVGRAVSRTSSTGSCRSPARRRRSPAAIA